jgi:release factor glutamine methyltransferase
VAYLTGEREFWSMPLAVDARVLVPRPETELVVEVACRVAPGARRVLDCGTGSGAIAAALANELPAATVIASDRDARCLAVASENLRRHAPRVHRVAADWLSAFRIGSFDLVVSNPPYLAERELTELEPEVARFEPRGALAAGPDGLDALTALVRQAPAVLAEGGWLVMEMGQGQAAAMTAAVGGAGCWDRSVVERDAAGIERVLAVRVREGRRWMSC